MSSPSVRLPAVLLTGALVACASTPPITTTPVPGPASPSGDERGAFLVRLGSDTLAGEQFTRTPTTLTGSGVVRSPTTLLRDYTATLRPDGTVERFELTARRAIGTVPPQRLTMTFGATGVTITTQVGDSAARTAQVVAEAGALPYVGNSYALLELATRAARRAARPGGGDTTRLTMVAVIGRAIATTVTTQGADSMLISLAGDAPYRARVDADGRILGVQGTPTQRVAVARLETLDIPVLSSERPIGTLSPTDTVRAQVGRAAVSVVYSRPSRRGRTILGGIVPYDEVWRTGANAATVLTTSADLTLAGTRLPRGSYTLWTLPTRAGWKLIINRQTGQWGTEYDAGRDLARVDLTSTPAAQPADQFTISIDGGSGTSGRLRLAWDDWELSAPVVAR